MAIKFRHNGRMWETDTVQEAIALRQKLESEDYGLMIQGEEPDVVTEPVWTPDSAHELLKSLGKLQNQFLEALFEVHGTVSSEQLIRSLKLDSEIAFAGVLSGLSKQVRKVGRKPSELYFVEVEWSGKNKSRRFRLGNNFRWVAAELGWPWKK